MHRDKLFVELDGVPLLEYTLAACQSVFDETVIVARESEKFKHLPCRLLLDPPDMAGPAAGVVAALRDCPGEAAFITAADLCDLNEVVLRTLLSQYSGEDYLGLKEADFLQPLCGIYHTSAASHIVSTARHGVTAMHRILADLHTRFVPITTGRWRNINRPVDLTGDTNHA